MIIELEDEDFKKVLGEAIINRDIIGNTETLGTQDQNREKNVLSYLLKVVEARMSKILPDDYHIKYIDIQVKIKGSPFGVGIDTQGTFRIENTQ